MFRLVSRAHVRLYDEDRADTLRGLLANNLIFIILCSRFIFLFYDFPLVQYCKHGDERGGRDEYTTTAIVVFFAVTLIGRGPRRFPASPARARILCKILEFNRCLKIYSNTPKIYLDTANDTNTVV